MGVSHITQLFSAYPEIWRDRMSAARRGVDAAVAKFRPLAHAAIESAGAKLERLGSRPWRPSHRVTRWLLAGLASVMVVGGVLLAGVLAWAVATLPLDRELDGPSQSLILEASDGTPLGRRGNFAEPATYAQIPEHLKAAVIAIEDRRFESHLGVDLRGIARATFRNISSGGYVEGASTITQQLVKVSWGDDSRTLARKIREALLAIWLETRLDKQQILTRYLNSVYMGQGIHGAASAARLYFDKDLGALSLQEAAMLAGLIKAPSRLNPITDLAAARERAALVLEAMAETGSISREAADQAKANPARVDRAREAQAGSWFADWAAGEAERVIGGVNGVMRVRTTVQPRVQEIAQRAIGDILASAGPGAPALQAAMVAMRPDGSVVAMVGGRDYAESQFNRAVSARRQPGSTFKLFVYLAALRNGYQPGDYIEDAPIEINGWSPSNYDGKYRGWVTVGDAFANSLNAATVRLATDVGLDEVIKAAQDLGIGEQLDPNPSLALGTTGISLLEMTAAYAGVQANRTRLAPRGIAGFSRTDEPRLYAVRALGGATEGLGHSRRPLIEMLRTVVTRGTGRRAALDGFAAGKTGTSQDYRDAWFVGFTDKLTVGVWVGKDDNSPMNRIAGGGLPARIWQQFMTEFESELGTSGEDAPAAADDARTVMSDLSGDFAESGCNIQACSRAYRSFRSSDCTYQPYEGERQYCARGRDAARDHAAGQAFGMDESYRAAGADRGPLPRIWKPVSGGPPKRGVGGHQTMRRAWNLDR